MEIGKTMNPLLFLFTLATASVWAVENPASPVPRSALAVEVPENSYLFAYFLHNGEDGLKWQVLNGGKSRLKPMGGKSKLMRDPCITTGPDGTFHMVWTDSWNSRTIGYASSKDLLT